MKKINYAIIGCGRIASRHIEAINLIPAAKLSAVCDIIEERAEKYASENNIRSYKNYHTMLKNENIDVVNIMTPSGMHPQHAIEIMENYKKHIIIEKPMALKIADGEKMIETAKKNGVKLFAVLQNRYNKAVKKIREAVVNGIFGKLVLGTVRLRWARGQAYYDRDPWRGTWLLDGGALTNQAIHHIDLLQWMFGEVESVFARAQTSLVKVEVEDTAVCTLKFKNGALGVIEATTAARPDDLEASLSILGEKGTAIIEGASVNKLVTWTFSDVDMSEFYERPPNVYGFGHNEFLAEVTESLINNTPPLIDGMEGLKCVRLLNAIYQSVEENREVFMSENPVSSKLGVFTGGKDIRDIYTLRN
jgi:predicted dehydrogenase